jgi:acetoin utilization deacetylase AcuC-like enzyme
VDRLLSGSAPTGFSVHRPPGHHAETARAMGFCLFNSIAVAARHALDAHGLQRVLIVDWDVHHGNGTNDIFHATDQVLFVSVHQSPLYPGTGPASDTGSGPGEGFTVNIPVAAGTGDPVYRSLVDHVAVPLIGSFEPQLVLVSAGFDAHRDDPLAGCRVTEHGFAAMARSVRAACDANGIRVGCVLEGGYALGPLARSVAATMAQLTPTPPPQPDEALEPAPEAIQTRERIARWWPDLGG